MFEKALVEPDIQMVEEEFFVPADFNALEYFRANTPKQKDNDIRIVYFLLTSACNFKCKYCFVKTRMKKPDNTYMTKEIAEKGLLLLKRNLNNEHETRIIFYGGEPLLNFEVMKYVVERVKELDMNISYTVMTNGSIVNSEIMDFLKENKFSVGVSIDGLEDTNDEMRIDENEKGTFNLINSTIATFIENGVNINFSCTISKHNMNKLDEIIAIADKYKIKSLGYNLPSENENIVLTEDEKQEIVRNLMKAEDIIFDKRIYEDRIILRRLKSFIEKTVFFKDCAGYGQQIAITPTGQVGVCHALWPDEVNNVKNVYFDIDVNYSELVKEHPYWIEWFNRTSFNMPACWNCEAISMCGGGCAKKPFLHTGNIWDIDTDICMLMKEAVPWTVWKYYELKVNPKSKKREPTSSEVLT